MKNHLWKYIICLLILCLNTAFALEIDEKLTFRVLSTSSSKKTVLTNRGLEDGLAVGDHAKFFLTTGVVARAVVIKASPSRSIWAIYRLIDEGQIVVDKVLNLKIASPVKVTEDSTKSLEDESTSEGSEKIKVDSETENGEEEKVSEKKKTNLSKNDQDDLDLLEEEESKPKVSKKNAKKNESVSRIHRELEHEIETYNTFSKNFEIWSTLGTSNFLSTTIEVDGSSEKFGGGTTALDTTIGFEKYFEDKARWYHRFSLVALGHYANQTVQTSDTVRSSAKVFEYGGGVNIHLFADPFAYDKAIAFFTILGGMGSADNSTETTGISTTRSGSTQFFSLGPGGKYFLKNGFGGRFLVDYYRRSESYVADETNLTRAMNKTVGGFRFQLGLSYRF